MKAESHHPDSALRDELLGVLTPLQRSVAELLGALPERPSKAVQVERALGLDTTLSWQVFRLAGATNPLAAGNHVPLPGAMERFLKAVAKQRVPGELVEAASNAFDRFNRFVEETVGDRATFETMLNSFGGRHSAQTQLRNKRNAFRAMSLIRGLRMKCGWCCRVMLPPASDDAQRMDTLVIRGRVAFQRLRSDVPMVVLRGTQRTAKPDADKPQITRESLGEAGDWPAELGLLPQFCEGELPRFRVTQLRSSGFEVEMLPTERGGVAPVTYVTAHVERGLPSPYSPLVNREYCFNNEILIPSEVFQHDMFIPEGLFPEPTLQVRSYFLGATWPRPESDRLLLDESAGAVGRGLAALHTADVPRYTDIMRHCLGKIDVPEGSLRLYRCRVAYPVPQSAIEVRFAFPPLTEA